MKQVVGMVLADRGQRRQYEGLDIFVFVCNKYLQFVVTRQGHTCVV